jgi:RecB family endonuclease NucS
MSRPLTYSEARAAHTCAWMIAKGGYIAKLRGDTPVFVEAVAQSLSTRLNISVTEARRLLVAKHGAIIDLPDERTADVMPWDPPRKTTPRTTKSLPPLP